MVVKLALPSAAGAREFESSVIPDDSLPGTRIAMSGRPVELPETLEAHKSRDWVVMNLDAAKDFFDITFQKSWSDRFRKR